MSLGALLDARGLPDRVAISNAETARFGVTIGRVEVGPESPCRAEAILALVHRADLDLVAVRYPADRVSWPAAFAQGDRAVYHADSLVYWECELSAAVELPTGTTSRVATPTDRALVHDLAVSTFGDYHSHYRANPRFRSADIALGYAEWAVDQVDRPGSAVVIVSQQGKDVAFAAVEVDGGRGEITLSGVPEGSRGRGAYRSSMAAAEEVLRARGCGSVVISTQVHNTVVQRVWAQRGYVPIHTFETAHFVRHELLTDLADGGR